MTRLVDGVRAFLDEDGWNYEVIQEPDYVAIRFRYSIGGGEALSVAIHIREELGLVGILAKPSCTVPPDRLRDVAEYVCRVNLCLHIGGFEFDFSDGDIRYKTGIDLEGTEATSMTYRNLLHSCLSSAGRHLPGLLKVISGELEPEAAVTT